MLDFREKESILPRTGNATEERFLGIHETTSPWVGKSNCVEKENILDLVSNPWANKKDLSTLLRAGRTQAAVVKKSNSISFPVCTG